MKNVALLACTALRAVALVYENKGGWKTDANGNVEMRDGNPVYVDANGNEKTMAVNTFSNLIGENRQYRERAQTAEASLKAFEGIDAEKAREALETVSKLDDKQLVDAGRLDDVRSEIEGRYKGQLEEATAARVAAEARADKITLDTAFSTSKFVNERVAIPADMLATAFKDNFKIENGNIVPYGTDGKPIYSSSRIGEIATFDEAISSLITSRDDKDKLLVANVNNGSGNNGGGGNRGNSRTMNRSEFGALNPIAKAEFSALVREGKASLVD